MTDTPLKPCPFCEGEAETDETIITDEFDEPTDAKECVVCCPECRIWFIGSTPAEAIAAWNSRPTPTSADNARVAREPVDDYPLYPHRLYTQDQLDAAVRAEREQIGFPEWATDEHIANGILEAAEAIVQLVIHDQTHRIAEYTGVIKSHAGTLLTRRAHIAKFLAAAIREGE